MKAPPQTRRQFIQHAATVAAAIGIVPPHVLAATGATPPGQPGTSKRLTARICNSQFAHGRATYNAVSCASDGNVYYVLSSAKLEVGGQMYRYSPATHEVRHLGDLTAACGEKDRRAIPQGKSHVSFAEVDGKLHFATHVAYYDVAGAKETKAEPPPGYLPYPGGHFLAYDLKSGQFEDLATAPFQEGIISMTMDRKRGRLYGLTWPTGYFLAYDLRSRTLRHVGPVEERGEAGEGAHYRAICRTLVVDPRDGAAYLTTSRGDILRYRYDRNALAPVPGVDLRKDYFGAFDPAAPGHMGYHWRQTVWYEPEGAIYGLHGNSGYLFRFLPREERLEVLERLTSEPSRRSGMADMYYYGYLGLGLGPDGRTLYYLTGGPIPGAGKPQHKTVIGVRGDENVHLVTYEIPTGRYKDHGPIFGEDGQQPTHVNSIAIGRDGSVYSIVNISGRTDLIRILPGQD
jgi:hypothetical protein